MLTGGNIEPRGLEEEMRSSYLDYAMSVIVGRALPDVRDGLKPVHRRVLYSMYESGLQPNRPHRKCANVVGGVMGNYHPHGDSAIYDTLVRLAQDFAMRYPLIDPQGNFGSIDNDPPAAMRYTEARLSRLATEMLRDIDADTVDFRPNYDESRQEPLVLPARFPNLLVNGSSGIAVGMATNIPPHNLREAIDAVVAYVDDPAIDVDGPDEAHQGPRLPDRRHHRRAQRHPRRLRDRARPGGRARPAHIEPMERGKERIIVTEMPYQVYKGDGRGDGSGLMQKIVEQVQNGRIKEIADLRDESDKSGIRLVIELKRDENPKVVLNKLYKHTQLQTTFGVNMVALVDGVPRTLGLLPIVRNYVDHQRDVIVRRTKYELREREARLHILDGLLIAIGNIDEVIELIRGSRDPDAARDGLIERFELSRIQAQAILDLRLQRLTALQTDEIKTEHAEVVERIKYLRDILGDEAKVMGLIREELLEIKAAYGDERRTKITHSEDEIDIEDLIADQQMVISITHSGYIKTLPLATYRQQKRGGIGVTGMDMKDDDYIEHLFVCSTHDFLLFFTNRGKVYREKVYELPEAQRTAKGRALVNMLPLREGERVQAVQATRDFSEGKYLVFATRKGQIKKTEFKAYNTPIKADGIIAIKIRDDDELVEVRRTSGDDDIIMVSALGPGRALQRGPGAADGPRHRWRARHERQPRRQPRAVHGRDPARHGAAGRDRERLRQAHRDRGVPGQGSRVDGCQDDRPDREEGRPCRSADGARAPRPGVHLAERDGAAHEREGHLEAGPAAQGVRVMNLRDDDHGQRGGAGDGERRGHLGGGPGGPAGAGDAAGGRRGARRDGDDRMRRETRARGREVHRSAGGRRPRTADASASIGRHQGKEVVRALSDSFLGTLEVPGR